MTGRMVRCANQPCVRRTRMIGAAPGETWTCDEPDCPKEAKAGRTFGQPKQKGAKR